MSNVNTFEAFFNLPAQIVTVNTATPLVVPAQGVYPGLPSPALVAGAGLYLGITDTVAGNMTIDGHPIAVRISGKVTTGASSTFLPSIYLGTSATLASNTTLGVGVASSAIATTTANFVIEAVFIWDSVSTKLNGYYTQIVNGVVGNAGALTATTPTTVASLSSMNFIPTFTFGTANSANSVTIAEFAIDRAS